MALSYFLAIANVAAETDTQTEDLCSAAQSAIKDAERVRGLTIKKPVVCKVEARDSIRKYVLRVVEQDIPPERLEYEEFIYKTLRLIPENFDYKKAIIELYTSQIGGYYDPRNKHFVMADWIPLSLQYPVAVHELTHALQDQYYNLKEFTDTKKLTTDALLARAALVEGDATAVMLDFVASKSGEPGLADRADSKALLDQNLMAISLGEHNDSASRAIAQLMIFPYTAGLTFTQRLLKRGGYKALDQAFKNPPEATREILQPELYPTGRSSISRFSNSDVKLNAGEKIIFSDVLGQFFLRVWLESRGMEANRANEIASYWNGDLLILSTNNNQRILRWLFDCRNQVLRQAITELTNDLQKSTVDAEFERSLALICYASDAASGELDTIE